MKKFIFGALVVAMLVMVVAAVAVSAAPATKVGVCHVTGSADNSVVGILVSQNALAAHTAHGDYLGKVDVLGNVYCDKKSPH